MYIRNLFLIFDFVNNEIMFLKLYIFYFEGIDINLVMMEGLKVLVSERNNLWVFILVFFMDG